MNPSVLSALLRAPVDASARLSVEQGEIMLPVELETLDELTAFKKQLRDENDYTMEKFRELVGKPTGSIKKEIDLLIKLYPELKPVTQRFTSIRAALRKLTKRIDDEMGVSPATLKEAAVFSRLYTHMRGRLVFYVDKDLKPGTYYIKLSTFQNGLKCEVVGEAKFSDPLPAPTSRR